MGIWAWVILFTVSALLATTVQYFFFRQGRKATDYDWVFIAGGVVLGGFTASVWYHIGPVVDGLYLLPALAGAVVIGGAVEILYRRFLRPRQTE